MAEPRGGRDRAELIAYGRLLAFCPVQTLYVVALSRLPVAVALLPEYLAPVLVALWVRVVGRARLPRSTWLGAGLAIAALGMVVQVWHGFRLDALGWRWGSARRAPWPRTSCCPTGLGSS